MSIGTSANSFKNAGVTVCFYKVIQNIQIGKNPKAFIKMSILYASVYLCSNEFVVFGGFAKQSIHKFNKSFYPSRLLCGG
jgi:hypothetical protein